MYIAMLMAKLRKSDYNYVIDLSRSLTLRTPQVRRLHPCIGGGEGGGGGGGGGGAGGASSVTPYMDIVLMLF